MKKLVFLFGMVGIACMDVKGMMPPAEQVCVDPGAACTEAFAQSQRDARLGELPNLLSRGNFLRIRSECIFHRECSDLKRLFVIANDTGIDWCCRRQNIADVVLKLDPRLRQIFGPAVRFAAELTIPSMYVKLPDGKWKYMGPHKYASILAFWDGPRSYEAFAQEQRRARQDELRDLLALRRF
jgi:hypothetical protein